MARTDPQVNIRMPAELKTQLESAAVDSGRSLNADIVSRLEASLSSDQSVVLEALTRLNMQLAERELTISSQEHDLHQLATKLIEAAELILASPVSAGQKITSKAALWRAIAQQYALDEPTWHAKRNANVLAYVAAKERVLTATPKSTVVGPLRPAPGVDLDRLAMADDLPPTEPPKRRMIFKRS